MLKNNKKSILLITNTFYPEIKGRTERLASRLKYLAYFGFRVYVASPKSCKFKPSIFRNDKGKIVNLVPSRNIISKYLFDILGYVTLKLKLLDQFTPYVIIAIPSLLQLIDRKRIDYVYSVCSPFSLHLIGLIVKKMRNVYWVAEFRDPWVPNKNYFKINAFRWLHKYLEKLVVKNADLILYYPGMQFMDVYMDEQYKEYAYKVHRLSCIGFGGVDLEKINKIEGVSGGGGKSDEFVIVYAGTFYGEYQNPNAFLKGLSLYFTSEQKNKIIVKFFGKWESAYDTLIDKLGLNDVVEVNGWVPFEKVVSEMKEADALLFFSRNLPGDADNIPGKIADYVAVKKPIFAVTKSDYKVCEYISSKQLGLCVDSDNPEEIANGLNLMVNKRYKLKVAPESFANISAEECTREFVRLLRT